MQRVAGYMLGYVQQKNPGRHKHTECVTPVEATYNASKERHLVWHRCWQGSAGKAKMKHSSHMIKRNNML